MRGMQNGIGRAGSSTSCFGECLDRLKGRGMSKCAFLDLKHALFVGVAMSTASCCMHLGSSGRGVCCLARMHLGMLERIALNIEEYRADHCLASNSTAPHISTVYPRSRKHLSFSISIRCSRQHAPLAYRRTAFCIVRSDIATHISMPATIA